MWVSLKVPCWVLRGLQPWLTLSCNLMKVCSPEDSIKSQLDSWPTKTESLLWGNRSLVLSLDFGVICYIVIDRWYRANSNVTPLLSIPNTLFYPLVHLHLSHCSWDRFKLLNIALKTLHNDWIQPTLPNSSFITTHGTWGNWSSLNCSNIPQSHLYHFAHTIPTFWNTSSLSLYLVHLHLLFEVPAHIFFLQEETTFQAGFGYLPFVPMPFPILCYSEHLSLCAVRAFASISWPGLQALRGQDTFLSFMHACMLVLS